MIITCIYDIQPDTAIVEQAIIPISDEASAQGAGMAGVFGGATKGLAGWAVSSIQSRVSYIISLICTTIYLFLLATVCKPKW